VKHGRRTDETESVSLCQRNQLIRMPQGTPVNYIIISTHVHNIWSCCSLGLHTPPGCHRIPRSHIIVYFSRIRPTSLVLKFCAYSTRIEWSVKRLASVCTGAHPHSYSVDTGSSVPGRWKGDSEADHPRPYSAKVKNVRNITSTPSYTFMEWCLATRTF